MSDRKWQRSSLRRVAEQLAAVGYRISQTTLRRLLAEMKYSLKANEKRLAGSSHPDRERQFEYIASQKRSFEASGMPIISVDTKKKELIGNFKNPGQTWRQTAEAVNDHDFEQDALGKATPYGIYDLKHNRGYVYVGQSADTPQFAVDNIVRWWLEAGCFLYPHANKLLILADAGDNGRPSLPDPGGRPTVPGVVASRGVADNHCYPTGTSKWNPVEHRLFSLISINWAGKPLRTFEFMLACIRGAKTDTGLQVKATLIEKVYEKGIRLAKTALATLSIELHTVCPRWNYTIRPRLSSV